MSIKIPLWTSSISTVYLFIYILQKECMHVWWFDIEIGEKLQVDHKIWWKKEIEEICLFLCLLSKWLSTFICFREVLINKQQGE